MCYNQHKIHVHFNLTQKKDPKTRTYKNIQKLKGSRKIIGLEITKDQRVRENMDKHLVNKLQY